MQLNNCVLVRQVKNRNECIETNKRRLVFLSWNIVIYQDTKSDSLGYRTSVTLLSTPHINDCNTVLSTLVKSNEKFSLKLMCVDKTHSS